MAVQPITDVLVVANDFDASCTLRSFSVSASCETLDVTTVCSSGWREYVAGLKSWQMSADGFLDFANDGQDEKFGEDGSFAGDLVPLSISMGSAVGSPAYAGRALHVDYQRFGEVGTLAPFSMSAVGKGQPLVRGTLLHPKTARTASGNGTGYQLGAVSSTQSIYLALHVLAISGAPTFSVVLESDDNSNFTSATTRITSGSFSASTGASWQSLAGAVADDYWRVRWVVTGGTNPSVTFVAVVGIATSS